MADVDGYFDVEFNSERTQAFANFFPPRGSGNSVSAQAVIENLRKRNVMYGYRESAIIKGIRDSEDNNAPVHKVLIAQGVLPEHGTDAQVLWKLDRQVIESALERTSNGSVDLRNVPESRLVSAGSVLATIIPARPGTPGKTLTTPLMSVKQTVGKDAHLSPGVGVRLSEDRLSLYAEVDGVAEYKSDRLTVHACRVVNGDLMPGDHTFSGSLLVRGDVKGCTLECAGDLTVMGTIAGGTMRCLGNMTVNRLARARCICDFDVIVSGQAMLCEVSAGGRILGLPGSCFSGGELSAQGGVEADMLTSHEGTTLRIVTGIDPITSVRLAEVDSQVAAAESNLQRISQTLRMMTSGGAQALPPEKREAVQKLSEQRRGLEVKVRELANSKRSLMLGSKNRPQIAPVICKSVLPGVQICLGNTARFIEVPMEQVAFYSDETSREVMVQSTLNAA